MPSRVALLVGLAATAAAQSSIVATAQATPALSTLVTAVQAVPALLTALSNPGTFTVFAPSNAAFNNVPPSVLSWLLNARTINNNALTSVLQFHALNSVVQSQQVPAPPGTTLTTLFNGGLPALTAVNTAGTVTITSGGATLATVTTPNVGCSNGVVHIVDSVLVPSNAGIPLQTVVQVASGNSDLSSLVAALTATGLATSTQLSTNAAAYTVFAPTNAAFAAVPAYISSNTTLLTQVLLYHVIAGRTYAANLPANTNATVATLNGQNINVLSAGGTVTVFAAGGNRATVTTADVDSSNAVVHLINTVLLPAGLPPAPSPAPRSGALSAAATVPALALAGLLGLAAAAW